MSTRRTHAFATLLAVLTFSVAPLLAQETTSTIIELEPSTQPIHVRVLFEYNPANEAVIAWTTTEAGEDHQVHIDTQPRNGDLDAYAHSYASDHSHPYTLREEEREAGMDGWSHNVHLTGLEPATAYYLVVASDGEVSEEYHFITAPDDDRPIRLIFGGDSRTPRPHRTHAENDRRLVNTLMAELLEEHEDIVAFAHGADYTNRAYWGELYHWLNDYELTTTANGRLMPIIPARGNHDRDIGFEEMFWWPERENDYYYVTHLSANVGLITLNSEISRGGSQRDWLEAMLQELRPDKRWLLAQYHHPAWPSVREFRTGAGTRNNWWPLFEAYNLDLAMTAHDHALKRTVPIRDNEIDLEHGIVEIGDGGLGVPPRDYQADRWYLQEPGMVNNEHHIHLLTFDDNRLHARAIGLDRENLDEFEFTHDRR